MTIRALFNDGILFVSAVVGSPSFHFISIVEGDESSVRCIFALAATRCNSINLLPLFFRLEISFYYIYWAKIWAWCVSENFSTNSVTNCTSKITFQQHLQRWNFLLCIHRISWSYIKRPRRDKVILNTHFFSFVHFSCFMRVCECLPFDLRLPFF